MRRCSGIGSIGLVGDAVSIHNLPIHHAHQGNLRRYGMVLNRITHDDNCIIPLLYNKE